MAPAVQAYAELAQAHGLTLTQLALAFCKSRPFVASTVIGATSIAHLQENIDAFGATLDTAALAAIDDIHLRFTNPAP